MHTYHPYGQFAPFAIFLIIAIVCAFFAATGRPNRPTWSWGEGAMLFFLLAIACGAGVILIGGRYT